MNAGFTQRILNLQPGDHLGLFYDKDPAEQMPALVPFIQGGLAKGERFVYVADDQPLDDLARRLAQGGINVDAARGQDRVRLWTRQEWLQPGSQAPPRQPPPVRQLVDEALRAGFTGVRFAIEMSWTPGPDSDVREIEDWESMLNATFVPGFPAQIICHYNRSRLSPEAMQAALRTHRQAILGGQVYRNLFYQSRLIPSRRELANSGAGDPGQAATLVEWMISQLKRSDRSEAEGEKLAGGEAVFPKPDVARATIEEILDGLPDGCAALDSEGRFTHVNEAAARLWGKPAAELLGKKCWQEFPALPAGAFERACTCAMTDRIPVEFAGVFPPGDRWFEIKVQFLSPGALSLCFRDITEQKRTCDAFAAERRSLETKLDARRTADCIENARLLGKITEVRDASERASRAKDTFLAALALELRAPLNPVLLVASEGAGNPHLSAEVREDFSNIARNVTVAARLIDDLLDPGDITRGKRALEMRALDLHDLLQDSLVRLRPELERKRIALTLGLRAKQQTVMGDAVRLQQAFWNVLSNAVKFTGEKGLVSLETRSIAAKGVLEVKISDTGIGMTRAELASEFSAFAGGNRAASGGSQRGGGPGFGLVHSRLLVELHGGRLCASSPGRGQGSTIVIELPLMPSKSKAGNAHAASRPADRSHLAARDEAAGICHRILLVEDHEPTRIALAKLLVRRHYEVATAGTAAEAVALADQKHFDLLVADIGLPDADGYELMATLRERHGLKGIAVTGYGMEQDIARGKAAGFVAHLIKPVSAQTFEHALAAISSR